MIYNVVPLKFVEREIDPTKPLFCDTETVGLLKEKGVHEHIANGTAIKLFQCMQDGWEVALLVEEPDITELRKLVLNHHTVWHNSAYDLTMLDLQMPDRCDDTFFLSKLHYFKQDKFTLDACFGYAMKYDPYEEADINKSVMQKTKWSGALSDSQLLYAAIDVYYMPQLWDDVKDGLEDINYRLDMKVLKHCLVMSKAGLPLKDLSQELHNTEAELESIESGMSFNPRSSQQVAVALDIHNGTGDELLAELIGSSDDINRVELAKQVREARGKSKYLSTYLRKMIGHDRWYGHFSPSTKSGRLASQANNLQNLPRQMKQFVGYEPTDGRVIVSADWAQLELRTICAIAEDKTMLKLFQDGVDVHGYVATMMFGEGYTKVQRQIAKTASFALLYGAGAKRYASILLKLTGIYLSESEANKVKRLWLNIFKGVASWQQDAIKSWRAGNHWFTPLGRRYKARLMTDFMSIRNQGSGAIAANLAFNYIMDKFTFEDSLMINYIHDSYQADCPNDPAVYEGVATLFADSIQEAWQEFGKLVPYARQIPMNVDVGVAYTFKEADDMADTCLFKITRKGSYE